MASQQIKDFIKIWLNYVYTLSYPDINRIIFHAKLDEVREKEKWENDYEPLGETPWIENA